MVLESREVQVEDPHANQNHLGAAYTGVVISAIVADAMTGDGTVVVGALLAGKSGEVYTVIQPTRGNDWLLPPGTEVFVIGESRTARVVPETDESWFWERPEPEPTVPPVVWREPRSSLEESGPRPE